MNNQSFKMCCNRQNGKLHCTFDADISKVGQASNGQSSNKYRYLTEPPFTEESESSTTVTITSPQQAPYTSLVKNPVQYWESNNPIRHNTGSTSVTITSSSDEEEIKLTNSSPHQYYPTPTPPLYRNFTRPAYEPKRSTGSKKVGADLGYDAGLFVSSVKCWFGNDNSKDRAQCMADDGYPKQWPPQYQ